MNTSSELFTLTLYKEHLLRGEQENICLHSSAILAMSNIAVKCPL